MELSNASGCVPCARDVLSRGAVEPLPGALRGAALGGGRRVLGAAGGASHRTTCQRPEDPPPLARCALGDALRRLGRDAAALAAYRAARPSKRQWKEVTKRRQRL